jgi:predicted P-loop ATPase
MVNGWLHPGQANHQLLVFISDKQGVGKTTFARLLLPPEWRLRYFNETLADYGNKDSKIAACTNLVINLDEIKKARSDREQDQLKALITMSYCHERLPYRKTPQMLLRRASFFGTTNDPNIIRNMEGSRRHFIIPVKSINYRAEIDYDKLYADLYDGLLTGEKHFLAGDEIEEVMEKNEQFREVSAEEELFLTNVKQPDDLHPGVWYTPTEILNQLNLRTSLNLFAYNVQKIGYLLAKYGYQRKRLHGGGWIYYVYIVPVEQAGM